MASHNAEFDAKCVGDAASVQIAACNCLRVLEDFSFITAGAFRV
jgi:hypothetical protein